MTKWMVENMISVRIYRLIVAFIVVMLITSADIWIETADAVEPANNIKVIYLSGINNSLTVTFDITNDSVEVILPDGRHVNLPRAISASGVRYTDGKETFWEHHGEGSYWVGDELIFHGKAE